MPQGPLTTADSERMGDAKVGTLRFEIFWAAIDPTPAPDDYNWTASDEVVANAARNGVAVLPFIAGTPPWVLALDGRECEPDKCPGYPPKSKEALAAWRGFLADAVDRYGPGGEFWDLNPSVPEVPIRDWQMWNEQNSQSFWRPKPDVKAYARLLDASHRAITGADRGARVILGGMFGTPLGGQKPAIAAWDFLAKLYRRPGVKHDFDGVAAHPYGSKLDKVLAQVELLRAEMKEAGDAKTDLWITEVGWASGGAPSPLNRGIAGQADRLDEAFSYFVKNRKRLGIANVTWYSWRDNSATGIGLCEWCPRSGLLNEDGTTKLSYDAFTEFTGGS
jgi:polysaccharide biosynthesis protein PslG